MKRKRFAQFVLTNKKNPERNKKYFGNKNFKVI